MDEKLLIQFGLSQNQARTYRALILRKSLRPTELSKLIGESRTNCYALLDKLVELGLANKTDDNKKFTYFPSSPLALKGIMESKRSELEKQISLLDRKMPQLLSSYQLGGSAPKIAHFRGKNEIISMYQAQVHEQSKDLYFVRSKTDVPFMGLQEMLKIRYSFGQNAKKKRFGITPIAFNVATNRNKDLRAGRLDRAWLRGDEYTSPVEWAVTGNKLHAILFQGEGYGVSIDHPEIAESFRQILVLLHKYVKISPQYSDVVVESKYDRLPNSIDNF